MLQFVQISGGCIAAEVNLRMIDAHWKQDFESTSSASGEPLSFNYKYGCIPETIVTIILITEFVTKCS